MKATPDTEQEPPCPAYSCTNLNCHWAPSAILCGLWASIAGPRESRPCTTASFRFIALRSPSQVLLHLSCIVRAKTSITCAAEHTNCASDVAKRTAARLPFAMGLHVVLHYGTCFSHYCTALSTRPSPAAALLLFTLRCLLFNLSEDACRLSLNVRGLAPRFCNLVASSSADIEFRRQDRGSSARPPDAVDIPRLAG